MEVTTRTHKLACNLVLAALLVPTLAYCGPRLRYITAGPMLHWNFGNGPSALSIGLEAAYWDYPPGDQVFSDGPTVPGDGEIGYGVDLGVEWEKNKLRIYAEPQLGMAVAGVSMGPVLEWNKEIQAFDFGAQGSIWANPIFAGADLRGRIIGGRKYLVPGLSAKLPIPL